jgi:hypothetical protein
VCESSKKKRGFRQTPFGANSKLEKEENDKHDTGTSTKMSAVIVVDMAIERAEECSCFSSCLCSLYFSLS